MEWPALTAVLIFSNRVEAWTRNVDFLLHQEGRPVAELTGNKTTVRVMQKDWEATDKATTWIRTKATNLTQPFVLYLGLNLPHPYPSMSSGENYGASTFLTSPYWLERVSEKTYEMNLSNAVIVLNVSQLCVIHCGAKDLVLRVHTSLFLGITVLHSLTSLPMIQ